MTINFPLFLLFLSENFPFHSVLLSIHLLRWFRFAFGNARTDGWNELRRCIRIAITCSIWLSNCNDNFFCVGTEPPTRNDRVALLFALNFVPLHVFSPLQSVPNAVASPLARLVGTTRRTFPLEIICIHFVVSLFGITAQRDQWKCRRIPKVYKSLSFVERRHRRNCNRKNFPWQRRAEASLLMLSYRDHRRDCFLLRTPQTCSLLRSVSTPFLHLQSSLSPFWLFVSEGFHFSLPQAHFLLLRSTKPARDRIEVNNISCRP